ncbi:hypothetical protein B0J12DRAFT_645817 [Macrophomina phaseolina]|uniref:Uncharacterized protein n=1 Tax=Macrophomina phaseolina TaxID=35725 RepID=A0ABQ8GRC3_9PEZI|nr:hypothetical protein B0J12DRAFT_645817 [Macrophomina phaseolina]
MAGPSRVALDADARRPWRRRRRCCCCCCLLEGPRRKKKIQQTGARVGNVWHPRRCSEQPAAGLTGSGRHSATAWSREEALTRGVFFSMLLPVFAAALHVGRDRQARGLSASPCSLHPSRQRSRQPSASPVPAPAPGTLATNATPHAHAAR